jgi:hypothetical protein
MFDSVSGINVKKVIITDHALLRAKQRSHWSKMKDEQIIGNLRALLKRAKRICNSVCERGNPSVMFAVDKYEIHLSPDLTKMHTIMRQEDITYAPIKNKMLELLEKEIRKLQRKEGARIKYLERLTYDCKVEMAELERQIFRTKSPSVKQSCQARLNAINTSIQEYKDEIKSIQDEKRRVSRSLVAVI